MKGVPSDIEVRKRYGLMISMIVPRPIAWVSSASKDGVLNLAPFSFFTGITAQPMTVCFAPVRNRHGVKKDTLQNIEETKEFAINIVPEALAEKMNQSSAEFPSEISEFEEAGLTPAACVKIRPPRVKESPVTMECKLHKIVTVSEGPLGGTLVIGEVVYLHVEDKLLTNGLVDIKKLKPIARLGGSSYLRATDIFELTRPRLDPRK